MVVVSELADILREEGIEIPYTQSCLYKAQMIDSFTLVEILEVIERHFGVSVRLRDLIDQGVSLDSLTLIINEHS